MSDYEFRCQECKKVTYTHSTGEIPKASESVECLFCGRISIVQDSLTTLFVSMSGTKVSPSELEKLEQLKLDAKKGVQE